MKQTKWFLLCCLLPIFLTSASAADQVTFLQSDCQEKGVYNQGSIYQENLYLLLSNLTSKANTNNFYNFTSGELPNRVYGLFLCSSVHMGQDCQDCITMATGELQRRCPSNLGAIIWYAECMLRYANHSIFSINDISVYYKIEAGPAKYSQYSQQLSSTVTSLLGEVNTKSSSLKSATTVVYVTKDISFNSYVDCTPDLTNSECSQCLATALTRLQFKGTQIGRLLQPSCRLMYVFMNIGFLSQEKMIYVASGILSAITAASLLLNVLIGLKRRNVKRELAGLDEIERMENLHLPFDALKEATDNFSATNRLGQGGFGIVYMGTLADGQAVAVKRLSDGSGQGIREFKTEACLAAKLQHKNLVKLYGFCLKGEEMLLVYEFLRNKSLDKFLFDPRQEVILNWETRYKIIMGTMQGLMYLHEDSIPNIIHRDLKPSNILLDEDMNPKLADFGMAKLFGADQTQGNTSKIVGTFGYMAPEYARTGNYSAKSDMFSLGVILLEIISGLKNSIPIQDAQNENLLDYARRLWLEGNYLKLVDSALANDLSEEEVNRCVEIALQCVQEDPSKRPNIASVMLMLTNQPISLPPPTSPPAFPNSRESTAISVESYVNPDGVITGLSPR